MMKGGSWLMKKHSKNKKRRLYLIGLVCIGLSGCLLFVILSKNEENTQNPVERYQESLQEEKEESASQADDGAQADATDASDVSAQTADTQEQTESMTMTYGSLSYAFLSYEVIDDSEIASQTTYPAECFYEGELPDPDATEEYIDREAIMEQCPELKEMWEDTENEKYSFEEQKEIYNANLDVIEANTYEIPSERYYVFVKVRITNLTDRRIEQYLNELDCVASSADLEEHGSRTTNTMCYFDKSVYTEGDDRTHLYFLHTFEPNETLECTLGFWGKDEIENPEYYIVVNEVELQNEGINPVLGKHVFCLGNLDDLGE